MPYGMYISAEGALAQGTRLETVANNLANADTSGFKRDLALFQARFAEETQRGGDHPGSGSINDLGGGVLTLETKTDYTIGPLKNTEMPTDFAIRGDGFFMVDKAGQSLLTRAGNFSLTPDGQLINADGYPVLSDDGTPVIINPDPGVPWQLTQDGSIEQAGTRVPLAVVQPDSMGDLAKVGENLFSPLAPVRPVDPGVRNVLAGWLEGSGVKPTSEMMEMIEASRAFEANVNMIRNQDAMLGTLVNRVLRVSA